jgi:hypothetical protein
MFSLSAPGLAPVRKAPPTRTWASLAGEGGSLLACCPSPAVLDLLGPACAACCAPAPSIVAFESHFPGSGARFYVIRSWQPACNTRMGSALPHMRVGAVNPRLAVTRARDPLWDPGATILQCSAQRARSETASQ